MDLSKLKGKIRVKKPKRLGRGVGSGKGKTAGRGHKGAGQRKGKTLPYAGFRGGNLAYFRRIPKRGFNSPNKKEYQIVNLVDIEKKLKDNKEIDSKVLKNADLIKDEKKPVKILGVVKDKFSLKAVFKADKYSARAKELIEKVGGEAKVLK
ncbi:MAG: 50S ribosomal protein L15 [Candidatus Omnitrophota bacterium]|nr:MAG: 50S ribosomal protein L15 [Candidatus Omnitrophota bacterium]